MFLRTRSLIATLWVGSGWTVGYLVAPTLFATLPDPMQAGSIAGSLFRVEAWLSVVCAAALLVLLAMAGRRNGSAAYRTQITLVAAMLACTVIGYFGLQPFMAALREGAATVAGGRTGRGGAHPVRHPARRCQRAAPGSKFARGGADPAAQEMMDGRK